MKKILLPFLLGLSSLASAQQDAKICPHVSPANGVFSSERLYRSSRIAIENGNEKSTIKIILYKQKNKNCESQVVANYEIEGSNPIVDSLFFERLHGKTNLFTIVHWNINHRGLGTYGSLYQVYAYKDDGLGRLIENKEITENNKMTGIDGYDTGVESSFQFKTANSVRKFLTNGVTHP